MSTLESQGLEPFFAAIEARLPHVIGHIAEAARPWFSEASSETLLRGFGEHLEPWLDSLRDEGSSAIEQQVGATCERVRGQGLPGAMVLALVEETRLRLLDVALEALDAGVPGAAEGARRVMRVAERALTTFDRSYREQVEQAERQMRLFKALADKAPDCIMYADEKYIIQYANTAYHRTIGRDVHGMPLYELLTRETLAEIGRGTAGDGIWEGIVEVRRSDGSRVRGHLVAFRVHDTGGQQYVRCGILRDLSEEERSIEEERRLREQVIAAQQSALRELSAPLMPLGEGTLAMPLVGEIDGPRAQRILEDLLRGISERGAQHVIVDITGVKVVDEEVAQGIVQAAQAARLLGAEVILTGIRATVARTLLELGADLGGVVTRSTLRAGVAHVLARRGEARS